MTTTIFSVTALLGQHCPVEMIPIEIDTVASLQPILDELSLPIHYYIKVLKRILSLNPMEWAYEKMGELQAIPATASSNMIATKRYYRPGNSESFITLVESPFLISQGTTGLVTWEASLYLVEQMMGTKKGRVLEIGCGVGLLGFMLSFESDSVFMTDCNPFVLEKCEENRRLNRIENASISYLDWTIIPKDFIIPFDLIVGADIVFDPAVIPSLVRTIRALNTKTIIACTIRNNQTFEYFLKLLGSGFVLWPRKIPSWFYYQSSHFEIVEIEPIL